MDPLLALVELAGVRAALDEAREAVDQALRHRALRRSGGSVAAEVGLRSAWASAALEGEQYSLEALRSGTITAPLAQGALRASAALDQLAPQWTRTPRQILARLHVLAARGLVADEALGRPVPLAPPAAARLDALCALVAAPTSVPALLRAAVVHGELVALQAFPGPNGVLARAAARLTLVADGLDPRGLIAPELGHLAREPEYVGSLNAFATGTPDGVRAWLKHASAATIVAAAEVEQIADRVTAAAAE